MSLGDFSIGEAALGQQRQRAAGTKTPRSRQTVAKSDSATLVPEPR